MSPNSHNLMLVKVTNLFNAWAAVASRGWLASSPLNGFSALYSVYKAMNGNVLAACKVIFMDRKTPDREKKAIQKEIQVHSALIHENIIRLQDALLVEDDGKNKYTPGAYLLLEMAHGGDLFDKIGKGYNSTTIPY
jgi:serine/threonine protein kinase